MKKSSKEPRPKTSKNEDCGIPRVLEAIHYEKVSETIPVKVHLSVKRCLKRIAGKQGVSTWVREAILEKLNRMTEESEG